MAARELQEVQANIDVEHIQVQEWVDGELERHVFMPDS